jgi:uncharacterized heparinase superfamily protein
MTAMLKKALWYKNRLAAMSAAEIMHRLDEATKKYIDARRDYKPSKQSIAHLPIWQTLRGRLDKGIAENILQEWKEIYRQARDGGLIFLSQVWPKYQAGQQWHLDPITGKEWPKSQPSFSINYRHNSGMGDVKYVWEINRLQHMQVIAGLAFVKRDYDISVFCLNEIESWIDNNLPWRGVNWASGIELAFRAISILIVLSLVGEYATTTQSAKIIATLEAHGKWLARYPSKYSSANNHRTAEGLGLFALGMLASLAQSSAWRDNGWDILLESAQTQILPDGSGAEQAIGYAAITLEMLRLGQLIAETTGMNVPESYKQRIAAGQNYLHWLTDSNSNIPRIGDDDEGHVLTPGLHNVLFSAEPKAAPEGIRTFPDGGMTAMRLPINGYDVLLAMDHGDLGYLSIAAHGHADALSLWLHIDGQPVLVDAGTYLYHSGGTWRDTFRGTKAHNTLSIEDTNSSTVAGPFNWSNKAKAQLVASNTVDKNWFLEGQHDGYSKKFGVIHQRRISALPTGFTITDQIVGDRPLSVEIGFLLHPDLSAAMQNDEVVISKNGASLLRLMNASLLNMEIGQPESADGGWYSPRFGIKQPTTRIVLKGQLVPGQKSIMHAVTG